MSIRGLTIVVGVVLLVTPALGDEVLHRYEGDVHVLDPSTGWLPGSPCESPCTELLEDGHFVLFWPEAGDLAYYGYRIAEPPEEPPPSLWVEWRFRSNHPFGWIFYTCDAEFYVHYGGMYDSVFMYGDAAISGEGGDVVSDLDIDEFHTYRFESLDGVSYWISVDGLVFMGGMHNSPNGYHTIQFSGLGGCTSDQIPNMKNEWDFVRFGTISFGERIIASDPPGGYLDPAVYSDLDRFTVTFDSANYVYIDDITVEVTGGTTPEVIQTRRREIDDVDTVEIVLDRPLPAGELTRFIFNDGQTRGVPRPSRSEGWGTDRSRVSSPSPALVFDKDGAPTLNGGAVTNVVNYCLGLGPTCGDGCCNVDEDCTTCPQDCDECGDGCCSATETACDCPDDCPANCGDGCCTHDETYLQCPADCEPIPAVSTWGLVVLTLLTLTAGTVILKRVRPSVGTRGF